MNFSSNAAKIVPLNRLCNAIKSIHTISSVHIPVINSFFVLTGGDSELSLESSCVLLSPFRKEKERHNCNKSEIHTYPSNQLKGRVVTG